MGWLRGVSIGIVSNNRVRAAAIIPYCATDMIVKVSTDSYLGHQHSFKIIPNRLSFKQCLFVTDDQYLLIRAIGLRRYSRCLLGDLIGLQGCRSIPIAQLHRCARVSIDTYSLFK